MTPEEQDRKLASLFRERVEYVAMGGELKWHEIKMMCIPAKEKAIVYRMKRGRTGRPVGGYTEERTICETHRRLMVECRFSQFPSTIAPWNFGVGSPWLTAPQVKKNV